MKPVVLIPAYNPDSQLIDYLKKLQSCGFNNIVIVNDGSKTTCNKIFTSLKNLHCTVLDHTKNLGKGAALKTGFSYIQKNHSNLGVITADADGQHAIVDIQAIAKKLQQNPHSIIIGSRKFDNHTPKRSRIGNILTKHCFAIITGTKLDDTQSGLRAIPQEFLDEFLKLKATGYEFEFDMLIKCIKKKFTLIQHPIKTIYINNNASSHFRPVIDSMKIYFVLLRFLVVGLSSAALDYVLFIVIFLLSKNLLCSMLTARSISMLFNYFVVKKHVFHSTLKHEKTFLKYVILVLLSGSAAYLIIRLLISWHIQIIIAKIFTEILMFL
ncbi:MAG: bifunctional glycosyltransferase family 2/GtrA family protein [Alcanivoracaceae bacterium]|nr:bifunctional glycosyltransferase family 2/GtrA family protein [Alcanivoracaceae bacterium]